MKKFTGLNRILYLTLFIAALTLPSGMNQKVMANCELKVQDPTTVNDDTIVSGEEEEYSISMIKLFNRI